MKPFQIFRAGRHTPMSGSPITFGDAELQAVAAAYDPAVHEAPIVVGHPKTDAPAYGWVESVAVKDGHLVATPHQVDATFGELVDAGRFKKVSASFYRPDSPGNPTPGSYYLRHVGFLGAQPPAVKGLRAIEFGEADADAVVEFADWHAPIAFAVIGRFAGRIRDWLIAEKGIEVADDIVSSWEVDELKRIAIESEPAPSPSPAFAEPTPTEETQMTDTGAARAAELERLAADLATREAAFAERERTARTAEDAAFVTRINTEGRLPTGLKDAAVALFAELSDGDTVEFGEAGAKTSPRQLLRDLLGALPPPVTTGEIAGGDSPAVDFADPVAISAAIVTEIEAAKAEGKNISAADALGRIQQKGA